MPVSDYFSSIFGKSPVRPMQVHINKAYECASTLKLFFTAVFAKDWDEAAKQQAQITLLENEADDMKKDIRMHLPGGIFMPVSRADLLELLKLQDTIANQAKDIAGLILGRRMDLPMAMSEDYMLFLQRCIDAVEQAVKTISELDELVETGFRGAEVDLVRTMIKTLEDIETDTDTQQVKVRAILYSMEKDMSPVDVIFLYQIIGWTGDLADVAHSIGNRLELMMAR